MSSANLPESMPCFACGEAVDPRLEACPACATGFRRLCACDQQVNAFAETCPACGLDQHPSRYVRPPSRRRAIALSAIAVFVLGLTALVLLRDGDDRQSLERWVLKERAAELAAMGDLAGARLDVLAVIERYERDAEAWYMLGVLERDLGLDREIYRGWALRAIEINPALTQPKTFLAQDSYLAGDYPDARLWAGRALESDDPPATAWRLVGELELERPRPNLGRALAALERAYRDESARDVKLLCLRALVRIRLMGQAPPERFPDSLRVVMDQAEAGLARQSRATRESPEIAPFRAELQLAAERFQAAQDIAERALESLGPEGDAALRGRLLFLRGAALFRRGEQDEALAAFAQALDAAPGGATAGRVHEFLSSIGRGATAVALIEAQGEGPGDHAMRGVLISHHLDNGELEAARRELDGLAAVQGDVDLDLLRAAVLAAEGEFDAAEALYRRMEEEGHAGDVPRLRRASLAIQRPLPLDELEASLLAELESLRADAERFTDDAAYEATVGALASELGRDEEAVAACERATVLEPWSPWTWSALGRVLGRSIGIPRHDERAADAHARAVALRPHDRAHVLESSAAQLAMGDPARAVGTCTVYLGAHPDDAVVLRQRARAHRKLGHWKSSGEDLRRMLDLGAAGELEAALLAKAYVEVDRQDLAQDLLRRLLAEQSPLVQPFARSLAEATGEPVAGVEGPRSDGPSLHAVVAALRSADIDGARRNLRAVLAANPGNVAAIRLFVLTLFLERESDPALRDEARSVVAGLPADAPNGLRGFLDGCLTLADGDARRASRTLRRAADTLRWDPYAAFFYGHALFAQGLWQEALPPLRRAVLLDAGTISVFARPVSQRLVAAADQTADPARRERLLREAVTIHPNSLPAVERLYAQLARAARFREAAGVLEARLDRGGLEREDALRLRREAVSSRLADRDAPGALAHLDVLERDDPGGQLIAALRGWLYVQTGRHEEARRVFAELLEAESGNRAATLGLIEALIQVGQVDEARQVAGTFRASAHDDVHMLDDVLVGALVRHGHLTAALAEARDAQVRRPDDAHTLSRLVWVYELMGREADAEGLLRDLVARSGDALRGPRQLALAELSLRTGGDTAGVIETARATAAAEDSDRATVRRAELLEIEGLVHGGDIEAADRALRRFLTTWLEDQPTAAEDRPLEHRVRFVQASVALSQDRLDDAARHLARALQIDGTNHAAANNLAWIYSRSAGTARHGLELARFATRVQPRNADYWDTLALCAAAADDAEAASDAWERALALFDVERPVRAVARGMAAMNFARLLRRTGKEQRAETLARTVVERAPGTAVARDAQTFLDRR